MRQQQFQLIRQTNRTDNSGYLFAGNGSMHPAKGTVRTQCVCALARRMRCHRNHEEFGDDGSSFPGGIPLCPVQIAKYFPHRTRPGAGIAGSGREKERDGEAGRYRAGRPTSGGHGDRPVGLTPWRNPVGLVPRTYVVVRAVSGVSEAPRSAGRAKASAQPTAKPAGSGRVPVPGTAARFMLKTGGGG